MLGHAVLANSTSAVLTFQVNATRAIAYEFTSNGSVVGALSLADIDSSNQYKVVLWVILLFDVVSCMSFCRYTKLIVT